jgi:hypothetical protein
MKNYSSFAAITGLFLLLMPLLSQAESEPESERSETMNSVGAFAGFTGANRRENGLTLALTYERRITESFGIGAEVERVFGDLDFWLVTVPFAYHRGSWKLFAGPGVEKPDGGDYEGLIRIGGEYGFEVSEKWEISPVLALDFVDSDTEVIGGVLFSYHF